MALLSPLGPQFFKNDGTVAAGCRLYTFQSGTTTQQNAFTDQAGATPHTYVSDGAGGTYIALDSAGKVQPHLWLTAGVEYRIRLNDSFGALIDEWDDIGGVSNVSLPIEDASVTVQRTEAGSVATTQHAVNQARAWFPVPDSGATGDGVADDTAELQAALDASLYVDLGGKSYLISSKLDLRSGHRIIGSGTTITQTLADTTPGTTTCEIFNVTAKTDIDITGIHFVGVGTDYADSDSSRATAIWGATSASRIHVHHCRFTNFTYSTLRLVNATSCSFTNNVVVGPGSPELTAVTSGRCYGVVFDSTSVGCLVANNSISKTAQGVRIEGCRDTRIVGNTLFDITGQHGVYAGSALNGITIAGNTIYNTDLCGIKVQAADAAGVDNIGISIVGNTLYDCGDQGILVCNAAGAATYKCRGVTVSGNTIRLIAANGIYSDNTIGAVFSNNTIDLTTQSGICIDEISEAVISNNNIRRAVLSGIRDVAACTHVQILDNKIKDCATGNTAGDEYGIFVQGGGSEYEIVGNKISDANANMQYGIYIAADINSSSSICDNIVSNATDAAIRFSATTALRKYKGNSWTGTIGLAFNDPVLPAVASAATITLPTAHDVISITGTTGITSINAAGHSGHKVTLVFSGALTVTDGSNLKMAGNFTTTADDTLTLVCDGTNWVEVARSVN